MILVDTSVWVDHLRAGEPRLTALLERSEVAMHPIVMGELACGSLRQRERLLSLWQELPQLAEVTHGEALYFLRHNQLWGRGIGYIDIHLLAAVAMDARSRLWTRDKRLNDAARHLALAHTEPMP